MKRDYSVKLGTLKAKGWTYKMKDFAMTDEELLGESAHEEWDDWGPVPEHVLERWEKARIKHEADRKTGKIKSFDNTEEALKYLHSQ